MTNDFKALLGENYEKELREEQKQLSSKRLTAMNPLIDYIEAFPNVASFVRGLGKGVSLGATDPLAALALQYTRKFTGGPETTFKEAYKEIKSQKLGGPGFVGELAGGTITGAGLGLGKTLLGTMGRGAAMGAVSGATATPYMQELPQNIGLGALIGGAAPLLGLALPKTIEKTGKEAAERLYGPEIKQIAERVQQKAKQQLDEKMVASDREQAELTMRELAKELNQLYKDYSISTTLKNMPSIVVGEALKGVLPAGIGAGGGALFGGLAGIDPYTAALYGGGGAAALSKFRTIQSAGEAGERILARVGSLYGEPMARTGVGVATAGQYVLTSQLSEQLANYRANEAAQEFMMRQQGQ